MSFAPGLLRMLAKLMAAGVVLAPVLWTAEWLIGPRLSGFRLREELTLASVAIVGAATYAVLLLVIYGRRWRGLLAGLPRLR